MIQTFYFPFGNKVQLSHGEDEAISPEDTIWATIGMFMHYIQQQSGELFVNDRRIIALSMAQTCGMAASPVDYVGIDYPVTQIKKLKDIVMWPLGE